MFFVKIWSYVCARMFVSSGVEAYVYIHSRMGLYICLCMHVCMYALCTYMYVCICMYMHVSINNFCVYANHVCRTIDV